MTSLIWMWVCNNPEWAIGLLLAVAEAITRLTPTKIDDGFIMRLGKIVKWFFDTVKIPNIKRK